MWLGWLIAIVILVLIEMFSKGLVSVWFIASGIIALIVSFFTNSFYIQFLVFGLFGIVLLITTKSYLEKKFCKKNSNSIIGMKGIVTKTINKDKDGGVKINEKTWVATSEKRILKKNTVIVEAIKDNKLVVKRVSKKNDR